jgi:hypothetical protein
MATPHVAGLASAIIALQGDKNQEEIRALLQSHTTAVTHESGKSIPEQISMESVMVEAGIQQMMFVQTAAEDTMVDSEAIEVQ